MKLKSWNEFWIVVGLFLLFAVIISLQPVRERVPKPQSRAVKLIKYGLERPSDTRFDRLTDWLGGTDSVSEGK